MTTDTIPDVSVVEPMPPLASPLLRVLTGRLAGAEYRLHAGRSVTVGHGFENDVVLRGRATQGLVMELHVGAELLLRVRSGAIDVLGRSLAAGEELILPAYLPVRLGDLAIAVGGDDPARWAEAATMASHGAATLAPELLLRPRSPLADRIAARAVPWLRLGRGRIMAGAAGLIALLALSVGVPVADAWHTAAARDPAKVRRQLATAGFGALDVARDPGGAGVLVTGAVATDRDAERLRAYVAARLPDALVEVESAAALAAAATDMLRANGVAAEARPLGARAIAVEGEFLPHDRQRELSALLRRDIPGLRRIDYRATDGGGSDELRHFFNSPQYGAASFVDGDPGYIVTADGSRWFDGAILPTGHRLVAVGHGRVTLERGGQVDVISM
ncbi:hypothetical protein ACMGDM_19020 [Sphingomonas sp. DT-51]|uniref:SctD/MshK family protein n=1 Tax=Sphingomonas sp. DT-51 TaxID=3396165 RepID=UPI003F1A6C9E